MYKYAARPPYTTEIYTPSPLVILYDKSNKTIIYIYIYVNSYYNITCYY